MAGPEHFIVHVKVTRVEAAPSGRGSERQIEDLVSLTQKASTLHAAARFVKGTLELAIDAAGMDTEPGPEPAVRPKRATQAGQHSFGCSANQTGFDSDCTCTAAR